MPWADRITAWASRWFHDVVGVAVDNFGNGSDFLPLFFVWPAMPAPSSWPDLGRSAPGRAPLVSQLLPFLCVQSGYRVTVHHTNPVVSCVCKSSLPLCSLSAALINKRRHRRHHRQQTNPTYKCRPEPAKGCKTIGSKSECDANRRCQWVPESERAKASCGVIHCRG